MCRGLKGLRAPSEEREFLRKALQYPRSEQPADDCAEHDAAYNGPEPAGAAARGGIEFVDRQFTLGGVRPGLFRIQCRHSRFSHRRRRDHSRHRTAGVKREVLAGCA